MINCPLATIKSGVEELRAKDGSGAATAHPESVRKNGPARKWFVVPTSGTACQVPLQATAEAKANEVVAAATRDINSKVANARAALCVAGRLPCGGALVLAVVLTADGIKYLIPSTSLEGNEYWSAILYDIGMLFGFNIFGALTGI